MGKKLSLYNISEEMEALQEMLKMDGGEITETHDDLMAMMSNMLTKKTDCCVEFMNQQKDMMKLAKERMATMKNFIDVRKKAMERFENYMLDCMDKLEKDEVLGSIYHVKKRKPSQVLEILDKDKIPSAYITIKPAEAIIDTVELKKAIKNNVITTDSAKLSDGKRSLQFELRPVK